MIDAQFGPIRLSIDCGKAAIGCASAVLIEMTIEDVLAGGFRDRFRRHAVLMEGILFLAVNRKRIATAAFKSQITICKACRLTLAVLSNFESIYLELELFNVCVCVCECSQVSL